MGLESALALIESVKDYRVLFMGDTIVDEYCYVSPLGKASKENIIAVRAEKNEVFRGGVEAAANHARQLCSEVDVSSAGRVVRKVRMVENNTVRKLFELHYLDGEVHPAIGGLPSGTYDAVIVTDFGHGAIQKNDIDRLCNGGTFLAVNAQTNSANTGYNLITKYPRADYIVIDEPEARLAASDRDSSIEEVIMKLAKNRCNKFVVTHGSQGAVGYDGEFHRAPAYTDRIVDTMGAGDAFFSVTALMAKHGSMRDLLRIGNAAGALKTQIVGHRKPIEKRELISFLKEHE